jgi:anti-anti-sigma factor
MLPEPPELTARTTFDGDCATLELAGEIDLSNSTRVNLEFELILSRSPPPTALHVDLAQVTFMDSMGVAVLVTARRNAAAARCHLTVTAMSPAIARLLSMTGLAGVLTGDG